MSREGILPKRKWNKSAALSPAALQLIIMVTIAVIASSIILVWLQPWKGEDEKTVLQSIEVDPDTMVDDALIVVTVTAWGPSNSTIPGVNITIQSSGATWYGETDANGTYIFHMIAHVEIGQVSNTVWINGTHEGVQKGAVIPVTLS